MEGGALASKWPSGQTPYLSWRLGNDGDWETEDKTPGSKKPQEDQATVRSLREKDADHWLLKGGGSHLE